MPHLVSIQSQPKLRLHVCGTLHLKVHASQEADNKAIGIKLRGIYPLITQTPLSGSIISGFRMYWFGKSAQENDLTISGT